MSIKKNIEVICDRCQKECSSSFLRIIDDSIRVKDCAVFAMEPFEDLVFCSWECIRGWPNKKDEP